MNTINSEIIQTYCQNFQLIVDNAIYCKVGLSLVLIIFNFKRYMLQYISIIVDNRKLVK